MKYQNETMLEAIKKAHEEIKKICHFIQNMKDEIGKPKFEYKSFATDPEVYKEMKKTLKKECTKMYKLLTKP